MPSQVPMSLINSVNQAVYAALESMDSSELKFASRRALNAFDSTQDLSFLAHYISCQSALNLENGYSLYQYFIDKLGLIPDPTDDSNTTFFGYFISATVQDSQVLYVSEESFQRAIKYAEIFIENWDKILWPSPFLFFLFEQGEFNQVRELSERLIEKSPEKYFQCANLFLMHVDIAEHNFVSAYNTFCELAEPYCDSEIKTVEKLFSLFRTVHFGMDVYHAKVVKYDDDIHTGLSRVSDAHGENRLSETFTNLYLLLKKQFLIQESMTDESEMSIEQVSDAWQSHIAYFGPPDETYDDYAPSSESLCFESEEGDSIETA